MAKFNPQITIQSPEGTETSFTPPAAADAGLRTRTTPTGSHSQSRSPRQGSLPRAARQKGRPRKQPPPPPPVSVLRRIQQSPYFLPGLVGGIVCLCLLLLSAFRIASHSNEVDYQLLYKEPASPAPTVPVSFATGQSPEPSSPTPVLLDEAARARALEKTWELEQEQVRQMEEAAALKEDKANKKNKKKTPPQKLGMSQQELEESRAKFALLQEELADMSADDLTQALHAMMGQQPA